MPRFGPNCTVCAARVGGEPKSVLNARMLRTKSAIRPEFLLESSEICFDLRMDIRHRLLPLRRVQ
jgi:hypothetical protein